MNNLLGENSKGISAAKNILPDERFREIFDQLAIDMDKEIQTGINGVEPNIIVFMVDGNEKQVIVRAVIPRLPKDFDERQSLLRAIGAKFVEESRATPIAVFSVSEAWMWKGDDPKDSFTSYEEHGERNRSEVIVLSGKTLDGRNLTQIYIVHRGEKDVFVLEEKLPLIIEGDDIGGDHSRFTSAIFEGGAEWMMSRIVKNIKSAGREIGDLLLDDKIISDAIDHVFDEQKGDNNNGHLN